MRARRRAPRKPPTTTTRKRPRATVPPMLAMMACAAEGLESAPATLAIAWRMMPAILRDVAAGRSTEAGSVCIHDAITAADAAFLAWSRDEDPLKAWYEDVQTITAALTAAGLDADQTLDNLRQFTGVHGFYVGLAYAYWLLAGKDGI